MKQQIEESRSPIVFPNPESALEWADAMIAVGRCDSQFRRIIKDAINQGIRVNSGVSLDDLHCVAHDISNGLRQVRPYDQACAFRHVYGLPSNHEKLQATLHIAEMLESDADGLRLARIQALALAALDSERDGQVNNRYYSASRFASKVGITRQAFLDSDRWMKLQGKAVASVRDALKSASKQLCAVLVEKGVM